VLSGLAAAHEAGVIHRDLKPSNIFLCKQRDGTQFVKLLDFGIAKLGVLGHTPATRASIMVGTPAYMAPEQASGGLVGPALDLYAIGCLAFELLTGRTPFEENSVVEMLVSHATKKPPHVATLNMGVPDELDSLVDQLLSKNPADRPASAEVVRREVARIRKGLADTTGRRLSVEIEAPPPTATLVDPPRAPSAPAPSRASKPIPPPPQANDTLLKPLDPELAPAESLVSTSILPKNARPSAPEQRAPTAPSLPPVDEEVLVAPKSKLPLVVAGVVAVAAGVGLVLAFNGPGRPDAPPPGAGGVKTARVDPPPPNPTVTSTAEPPAPPVTPPAPVEPPAPGPAVAPAAPAAVELAPARPAPVARAAPPGPPAPAVPPPAPQPAPPPREALPTRPTAPSPVAPAPKVERSAPPAPEARSAPSANPAVAKLQARAKKLEAALARLQASGEDVTMNARLVTKVRQQLATPGLSRDDLDSLEAALNRIESELAP
jgi:serine/threonine-protein kinase